MVYNEAKMKHQRQIIFTREGYETLQKKHEQLLRERKDAVEQLKKAREMGDLSENGFYKAAKAKLGSIDHQLRQTAHSLRFGKVIQASSSDTIQIGTPIYIDDGNRKREITLVGEQEADPLQGKISAYSPLGKGLIGKKQGEAVEIETPKGKMKYTIEKIR